MDLKDRFETICVEYVGLFCKKHEFDFSDFSWIDIGGVVGIADYFFNFTDIRYDIDHDIPQLVMIEYYDYSLDKYSAGLPCVNYENFVKGAR